MKSLAAVAGLSAGLALSATTASAADFIVDALANSANSGGGTGLSTIDLVAGQAFTSTVDPNDLWSAGPLPRWSNADGLVHLVATGTDESGEAAGTLIGRDFGLLTIDGFSAPFGSLVGQIGTGTDSYRLLGTNFTGTAWGDGTLTLFYWDNLTPDNEGSVTANIVSGGGGLGLVPEPASWALMIVGFACAGGLMRRRRALGFT
jgi:hypothetical protein